MTERGISRPLLRLLARAVLACLASLLLWSVLPMVLGWHPTVVMSGSMAPALRPGDVVVTREVPAAEVRAPEVALVPDPDHPQRLRLHRVQEVRADGRLVLRGDANRSADSSTVAAGDVVGVGVLRIPLVGSPARAARSGQWLLVGLMAGALALLVALAGDRSGPSIRRPGPPRAPGPRRTGVRTRPPLRRWSPALRRLAVPVAVAVLLTVEAPGGFAAFASTSVNTTNQFTAAATFYPYKDSVLADSPVLYWRLGETSGTSAANTASTGPAGTYYSGPSLGQPSALRSEIVNKSISTTAGGFVTATTAATAPTQFTVEAWIKTTSTAGGRILGFGNGATTTLSTTADRQLYLAPTGKVVAGLRNASTTKTVATSPLAYNDGAWHHLAATYNGTILRLYVDGAQVASTTTTAAATFSGYWRAASENLSGWPSAPTGNTLAAGLDELAVYGTALSATRIAAHVAAAS